MYIDIQKFKKGQLYSRPEWNTETKKESIFCEGLNTYLLVAVQNDRTWSVTKDDYVMNHGFLFDDYFEVNDPLHYSHKIQESKLKEAIEEIQKSKGIKDILTVPCKSNPYMQYGTGNLQITQPPVTSTAYMGYFTGSEQCNLLNKVPEKESYDYAKLMSVNGIYDKDIVAKSEINILINKFLQTIPNQFRKSFFEEIDFTEATVESTKQYISDFSEKNRLGKLKNKENDSI